MVVTVRNGFLFRGRDGVDSYLHQAEPLDCPESSASVVEAREILHGQATHDSPSIVARCSQRDRHFNKGEENLPRLRRRSPLINLLTEKVRGYCAMSKKTLAVPAVVVPAVVLDPSQASFNLEQLGVYLGLSLWQARTLVWEGKIPALKVGRNYVVRRVDADAFLARAVAPMPCSSDWLKKRQAVRA